MNQRISQFLAAENITQAQFADTIEVAKASVSHVLSGRNNPGYDFIRSVAIHYPYLNLDWLLTGKGKMYKSGSGPQEAPSEDLFAQATAPSSVKSAPKPVENDLFASATLPTESPFPAPQAAKPAVQEASAASAAPVQQVAYAPSAAHVAPGLAVQAQIPQSQRHIDKIMVFYTDGTYSELK